MKLVSPLFLFGLLTLAIASPALTIEGGDVSSGGGDSLVMAFTIAGQKACLYLQKSKPGTIPISVESFCRAVAGDVKVTSDEETILHGVEVDAINTPSRKTIVLSQRRNKDKDIYKLKALAVHEYLSVLGVEDSKFQISGPIADELAKESDYFPVRYCEAHSILQVGSVLESRLKERSHLHVKFKSSFDGSDDERFWFDFSRPLRFVTDKDRKKIDVLQWLQTMKAEEERCTPLVDRFNRAAGFLCVNYFGEVDILRDYLEASMNPPTLVQMKLSKLRSLEDIQFINAAEENSAADFTHSKGYVDSLGYQGTHLTFSKGFRVSETGSSPLETFGYEKFQVDCY